MARNRPRGTLFDYLVAAIEPALIMIMVSSVMFFLLDLCYQGPFLERLRWIMFWFVLGIVMITRVSMQIGSSLAIGYGVVLGGAVALVASVLAGFQPFLLIILGVVWWMTHKLTFDCTLLDDDQDAGVGLLQETGLDRSDLAQPTPSTPSASAPADAESMDTSLLPERPWWKKLGEVDSPDHARRPHAPGVWLVYFTLASLPFFGLGQWFVPAVEQERRGWLFIYFLAYISSGMGLLLATSFLNLRRYLRQRRLTMPAAMTATWLSTGAILIVGLTLMAALMPLPGTGMGILRGSPTKSSDLRASNSAILKDSGVQGEGAQSEGPAGSKAKAPPGARGKSKGSGQTNDPNAGQETAGKGRPGGKNGPGKSKSGAPTGKSSPSKSGAAGKKGSSRRDDAADQAKSQDDRTENKAEPAKDSDSEPDDKNGSDQKNQNESQDNEKPSDTSTPPSRLPSLSFEAPGWLRMLVIVAGVIALIFGLFRYGAVLLDALRDFLASLFGGFSREKKKQRAQELVAALSAPAVARRPFSSFADPFDSGMAERFSPNDLIIYSFDALEAWAFEHNLARSPHETPTEFVRRLGLARDNLRQDSTRLVGYFVTIVYGQQGFKDDVLPPLRQFWRVLHGS